MCNTNELRERFLNRTPQPHAVRVQQSSFLCSITFHYSDVIMSQMASQITCVSIVFSTNCSGADQRKHEIPASLTFVAEIHRWPANSPHKGPVTRQMFSFDDTYHSQSIFLKPNNGNLWKSTTRFRKILIFASRHFPRLTFWKWFGRSHVFPNYHCWYPDLLWEYTLELKHAWFVLITYIKR